MWSLVMSSRARWMLKTACCATRVLQVRSAGENGSAGEVSGLRTAHRDSPRGQRSGKPSSAERSTAALRVCPCERSEDFGWEDGERGVDTKRGVNKARPARREVRPFPCNVEQKARPAGCKYRRHRKRREREEEGGGEGRDECRKQQRKKEQERSGL